MDWNKPIDIYCERLDASFWAEPVNALSNLAFWVAGYFAYLAFKQTKKSPKETPYLIALLFVIGAGSFLFHTFANRWSMLADVLPILFFQILALWIFLKRFLEYTTALSLSLMLLFVIVSQGLSTYVPSSFLNGSAGYLPSLLAQWLIAYKLQYKQSAASQRMWLAGSIFTCSLMLRSVDMSLCSQFPLGTHFLWHSLNALMLYVVVSAVLRPKNTSQAQA